MPLCALSQTQRRNQKDFHGSNSGVATADIENDRRGVHPSSLLVALKIVVSQKWFERIRIKSEFFSESSLASHSPHKDTLSVI